MLRSSLVLACLVSLPVIANADAADPAAGAPAVPPAPVTTASSTAAPAAPAESSDGVTLRNGFSLSAGEEFGTTTQMQSFSGQLFGVDWRIGAQINKAFAVYLDSHLSFGTVGPAQGSGGGVTGNFASALMGEYTLPMRLFVGAGGGYGVLNNPNGPLLAARVGYYPFANTAQGKSRRMNIALDTRFYMVGDPYGTVSQVSLSLGYDRF
jgi:hypothetical protein